MPRKRFDRGRQEPGRQRLRGGNSHFANLRIGQELDVFDTGPELVESRLTAPHQCQAIHRWLNAMRGPIKQANFKCMLKGGYRLRHRGLRHTKMGASLGHAAVLDDGEQDVEIA